MRGSPDRLGEEKGGVGRFVDDLTRGETDFVGNDAVFVWSDPRCHGGMRGIGETGEARSHFVRGSTVGGEFVEEGCLALFKVVSAETGDADPDDDCRAVPGVLHDGGRFVGLILFHDDLGRGICPPIFLQNALGRFVTLESDS